MTSILWRPELNALTTPRSYRARPVPRTVLGYDELAEKISDKNPIWTPGLVKSVLEAMSTEIREQLTEGNQVTLENAFTFQLSLAARLDTVDEPLPPAEEIIRVKVHASRPFIEDIQQEAELERLPPSEKQPVIAGAEDTSFRLNDVLNPEGVLRLSGTDLFFVPDQDGGECVLEGTRSGRQVQSRFAKIANSEVLLVPDIPDQPDPWNNEYRVSISTRYTVNGTLRTGTYNRPLRTPLEVMLGGGYGILSGDGANPLVIAGDGVMTAESTLVRIQALLDARAGDLRLSLLDMPAQGAVGAEVVVTGNGTYTLPGFAGSDLSGLEVTVNHYNRLEEMVRTGYAGRVVDILYVRAGT